MRRTQLYLQEGILKSLRVRSRREGKTISELVREAIAEKYEKAAVDRRTAMKGIIGIWKDREMPDSTRYVKQLRKGKRLKRLAH